MIHMRIVQEGQTVVDLPEWPGPVPQVGHYIFHPPYGPGASEGIAGCVKVVTWRTHDRRDPTVDKRLSGFVMAADPYVEVTI